jgi:xanthine dehydrogenase small subunit
MCARPTLLDWLRLDRRLRGSKEGCAEGDCGACTVLVGRLKGDEVAYETQHGVHPVCREPRRHACGDHRASVGKDRVNPVQQAMVDQHGSQCGFCTPGIVMSLYGLWLKKPDPTPGRDRDGAAGQSMPLHRLCADHPRRRGDGPAWLAGGRSAWADAHAIREKLKALRDGKRVEIGEGKASA